MLKVFKSRVISLVLAIVFLISTLQMSLLTVYATDVNLALNLVKDVTCKASSRSTASYEPNNAFNENTNNYWRSSSGDIIPWIRADIGALKYISSFVLREHSDASYKILSYVIEVSNNVEDWDMTDADGTNDTDTWETVYVGTTIGSAVNALTIDNSQFLAPYTGQNILDKRYVQIRVTGRHNNTSITLKEFKVFGNFSLSDEAIVNLDADKLVVPETAGGDFAMATVGDSTFTTINWTSDDSDLILIEDGMAYVKRPAIGEGDKSTTLRATITLNDEIAYKNFPVTVKEVAADPPVYSKYQQIFSDNFNSYSQREDALGKWTISGIDANLKTPVEFVSTPLDPANKFMSMSFTGTTLWRESPYFYPSRSFDLQNNKVYIRFKILNSLRYSSSFLRILEMDDAGNLLLGGAATIQEAGVTLFQTRSDNILNLRGSIQSNYTAKSNYWHDVMIELDYTNGVDGTASMYVDGQKVSNDNNIVSLSSIDITKAAFVYTYKAGSDVQTLSIDDFEIGYSPFALTKASFNDGTTDIDNITEAGDITVKVYATNNDESESMSFDMIVAHFQDNILTNVESKTFTINPETTAELCDMTINITQPVGASVKVFKWDALNSLIPLGEADSIEYTLIP